MPVAVPALADCLDGFEHHDTQCYKVLPLEASWIEAKQYCRLLGTELLVIETAAEETTIEGILTKLHGSHLDEVYWVSGSDMISENNWLWLTGDGFSVPMGFTDWAVGRPDNVGGHEDCLVIHYHGVTRTSWKDEMCSNQHSFICEINKNDLHRLSYTYF
ncbi:perlucin-like [Mya arenaria]|uniref:perlucin-like n=1 Tax=Mya arenaria TaxID=6604 RepID=UPI0022E05D48|nr:perlucin-like [Mya arenaria]